MSNKQQNPNFLEKQPIQTRTTSQRNKAKLILKVQNDFATSFVGVAPNSARNIVSYSPRRLKTLSPLKTQSHDNAEGYFIPSPPHLLPNIEKDKANTLSHVLSPVRGSKIIINNLDLPGITSDSKAQISTIKSHREQYSIENRNSLFKSKDELSPPKIDDKRPSFLAPTVATLQHMKEAKLRKDAGERGFSFSRPTETYGEYYGGQNVIEEARKSITGSATNSSRLSIYSTTNNKSLFSRNQNNHFAKNSLLKNRGQKASVLLDKINKHENEEKAIKKEKKRISNVLSKELEAKWGIKILDTSSATTEGDDEEKQGSQESSEGSQESQDECSEINCSNTAETVKKEQEDLNEFFESKAEDAKSLANSKIINSQISLKNKRFFLDYPIDKFPDNSQEKKPSDEKYIASEIDLTRSQTTREYREISRDDLFKENSSDFFHFNEESKLLSKLSEAYENKDISDYLNLEKKKNYDQSSPIVVTFGSNNTIIQPVYMRHKGSMCVTEFWSKKSNDVFSRQYANDSNRVIVKKPGREYETVYRPFHWREQEKIREKIIITTQAENLVLNSLNSKAVRKPGHPFTPKSESNSPQKQDLRKTMNKSPLSLLKRIQAAEAHGSASNLNHLRRTNNFSEGIQTEILNINQEKSPLSVKGSALNTDLKRLKSVPSQKKLEIGEYLLNKLSNSKSNQINSGALVPNRNSEPSNSRKKKVHNNGKNREESG